MLFQIIGRPQVLNLQMTNAMNVRCSSSPTRQHGLKCILLLSTCDIISLLEGDTQQSTRKSYFDKIVIIYKDKPRIL